MRLNQRRWILIALWAVLCQAQLRAAPFAFVANNASNNVSVIDVATNTVVNTIALATQTNPKAVAASATTSRAFVGGAAVYAINTFAGTVGTSPLLSANVSSLVLNKVGSILFATVPSQSSGQVCRVDTGGTLSPVCVNVGAAPSGLALSPDESKLVVSNQNSNTASVIDVATNSVVATVPVGAEPWGVSFSADGARAFIANFGPDTVSVLDMATLSVIDTIPVATNPISIVTHPNGNVAYVTGGLGTLTSLDLHSLAVLSTISVGSGAFGISITRDGNWLFVANSGANTVSVVRTSDFVVVDTIAVGQSPLSAGQFIGGGKLLDIDGDGEVRATTDSLLLLRWQLGIRGAALIANAVSPVGSTRTSIQEIEAYLAKIDSLGSP